MSEEEKQKVIKKHFQLIAFKQLTDEEKKILTKSLVLVDTEPKSSAGKELTNKFKNRFNETDFAKKIFSSDAYKDFLKLKSEYQDFRSDMNEYIQNSNNIII